jgi:hypothetical protein
LYAISRGTDLNSVRIIISGKKKKGSSLKTRSGAIFRGKTAKRKSEIFAQVLLGDTDESYTFERSNVAKTWQSYKKILRESNFQNLVAVDEKESRIFKVSQNWILQMPDITIVNNAYLSEINIIINYLKVRFADRGAPLKLRFIICGE